MFTYWLLMFNVYRAYDLQLADAMNDLQEQVSFHKWNNLYNFF